MRVISALLVITGSGIRVSTGTSDTTVISFTKTKAHNLNTTIASAAQRDSLYLANPQGGTAENCRLHRKKLYRKR